MARTVGIKKKEDRLAPCGSDGVSDMCRDVKLRTEEVICDNNRNKHAKCDYE